MSNAETNATANTKANARTSATTDWRNWSGRLRATPTRVVAPADTGEVAAAVKSAVRDGLRVKAAGAGHSFSEIAVPDGVLLRTDRLARPLSVDASTGLVTVQGGMSLGTLNALLAGHGLAMENLGDIDRQTIAGATSTGTHGTGVRFGSISTQLRAMELVLADGSVLRCSAEENPDVFELARVGLGALGIVTAVTLQCVPAFALHAVEEPMPLERTLDELDALVDGNDHFEFFWFPHTRTALTRRNTRLPADTPLRPIGRFRHWFDERLTTNLAFGALLRAGSAYPRSIPAITRFASVALSRRDYVDQSRHVFASERDVRFNEGEYAFPREHTADVLREVKRWVDAHDEPVSFPLEVRFVAGDDIPLAPTHERTSAYVAFHQYSRLPYQRYFDAMEDILGAVGGRPHWGKQHRLTTTELSARYPRFPDFVALRDRLDPGRVFTNPYLERTLGA